MVSPTRILLVEENDGVLEQILDASGYDVVRFDSADEAIASARESLVPVVVFFGSLRAFHALEARHEPDLRRVPVILATGFRPLPEIVGVDVIEKPVTIETLLAAVERATSR